MIGNKCATQKSRVIKLVTGSLLIFCVTMVMVGYIYLH